VSAGQDSEFVHVAGKINPANIFTKEMKDRTHFCRLRNSFVIHLSDFVNDSLLDLHHACQHSPQVTRPAALVSLASRCPLTWPLSRPLLSVIPCQMLPTFAVPVDISFGSMIAWFLLVFFSQASPPCRRPPFLFFSQFELTRGVPRHFLDPLEIYSLFLCWMQGWGVLACPWSV
jgi:hypothetical protein